MLKMVICIIIVIQSSTIVEYKFWKYYGELIFDSSGRGMHGRNGMSLYDTNRNVINTDRGAYFYQNSIVYINDNSLAMTYPSTFTVLIWMLAKESLTNMEYIFSRWDHSFAIHIIKSFGNIYYYINENNSPHTDNVTGFWPVNSNIYLGSWVLLSYEVHQNNHYIRINNNEATITTTIETYFHTYYIGTFIGIDDDLKESFTGFMWYFAIVNATSVFTNYMHQKSLNCFLGACSCTSGLIIPNGETFCVMVSFDLNTDSRSNNCNTVYPCRNFLDLNCRCPSKSCRIDSDTDCYCNDLSTGSSSFTACSCSLIGQGCCMPQCTSCRTETTCLTCLAANAHLDSLGDCICDDGYYGARPLVSAGSCLRCLDECRTCSNGISCLICNDTNASVDNSRCRCNPKFYGTYPLFSNTCQKCLDECATCIDGDTCTSCSDLHSFLVNGRCICIPEYYGANPLMNETCKPCLSECSECTDGVTCTACKDTNAELVKGQCVCAEGFYLSIIGSQKICKACLDECSTCADSAGCIKCVDQNSKTVNGRCQCLTGFYGKYPLEKNKCNKCQPDCLECRDSDSCISCIAENSSLVDNRCICNSGYWNSTEINSKVSCKICSSQCLTCKLFDFCILCSDINRTALDDGICICKNNYYLTSEKACHSCDELCSPCGSQSYCKTCLQTFDNILNKKICENDCLSNPDLYKGTCNCKAHISSYKIKCNDYYFNMSQKVSARNIIFLTFSETPEKPLTASDVIIDFNLSIPYSVIRAAVNKFMIVFNIRENIKDKTPFTLHIIQQPYYSLAFSKLDNYSYAGYLNAYHYSESNTAISSAQSSSTAQGAVSLTIGLSITSNPAAAWVLISTLTLISFIPLSSEPLPAEIEEFCTGIGNFNLMPNIMSRLMISDSSSLPSDRAQAVGISSSVFWINFGPIATYAIIAVAFWPFIKILSKLKTGNFSRKIDSLLNNYKYGFFLRFWIQAYMDIGVFSLLSIKAKYQANAVEFYINQISAVVFIVVFTLTPYVLFIVIYVNYERVKNSDDHEFHLKYGSFFYEFKNDRGFFSSIYYVLYFARRAVYLVSLFYLSHYVILEKVIHIVCSAVFIAYLLYYRPFKETYIMISNMVGEICIFIVFVSNLLLTLYPTASVAYYIKNFFVYIVLCAMLLQSVFSLYSFYLEIKKFIRKRNKEILRNLRVGAIISNSDLDRKIK